MFDRSLRPLSYQARAAAISPGSSHIASCNIADAVGITQQIGASVPLYVITFDGLDHPPTFTASGATFANPLPEDMSD